MIHDPEKKLIILLLPKTGSTSIRHIFGNQLDPAGEAGGPAGIYHTIDTRGILIPNMTGNPYATVVGSHIKYNEISYVLPNIDLNEYTVYGFYREPVARFMSTFKYFQQQLLTDLSAKALEGEFTELKLIYKALYNDEDLTRSIGSVTVDDIINSPNPAGLRGPVLDLFRPQTLYLTDKVTLLDFDDFENNVKMLLEAFGQDINTPIPRYNNTNSANYLSDLTEEQVTKIKEIYAVDYAFFESRNITF